MQAKRHTQNASRHKGIKWHTDGVSGGMKRAQLLEQDTGV